MTAALPRCEATGTGRRRPARPPATAPRTLRLPAAPRTPAAASRAPLGAPGTSALRAAAPVQEAPCP